MSCTWFCIFSLPVLPVYFYKITFNISMTTLDIQNLVMKIRHQSLGRYDIYKFWIPEQLKQAIASNYNKNNK